MKFTTETKCKFKMIFYLFLTLICFLTSFYLAIQNTNSITDTLFWGFQVFVSIIMLFLVWIEIVALKPLRDKKDKLYHKEVVVSKTEGIEDKA